MTYNDAMDKIQNPYNLNATDEAIGGYTGAPEGTPTTGYRVYMLDEKGHRYSPVRERKVDDTEHQVYYWHDKDIAKAYMVYLAEAYRNHERTYGLFRVEATKGHRLGMYNEHVAHYGQVAQDLRVVDDELIAVLTPEMLNSARTHPDDTLFGD